MKIWLYIGVMALVTYLIRMLPLVLIRRKIQNQFLRSFLYYVPYVTLSVMIFPAILYATETVWAGVGALLVAAVLAYRGKSLFTVASAACATVFLIECFMTFVL